MKKKNCTLYYITALGKFVGAALRPPMVGAADPWDIEVQSDGHQADGDGDGKGDDGADFQGDLKGDDGAVQEDTAQEGRRRVDFLAQDAGDAPGQDVADDAAADSRQDAEGDVEDPVVGIIEAAQKGPGNRKGAEADGVADEIPDGELADDAAPHADIEIADDNRDDGHGAEDDPQIDTVLKSSRRDIADEDVADDTAADSRRRTEDEDAEEVHAP